MNTLTPVFDSGLREVEIDSVGPFCSPPVSKHTQLLVVHQDSVADPEVVAGSDGASILDLCMRSVADSIASWTAWDEFMTHS